MKDISLHLLDIVQNSIRAESSEIEIIITESDLNNSFSISIIDNGIGMSEEMQKQVTDPFFTTRTTRNVGLGISLLKQNAERTGGEFNLTSEIGKGTSINVTFKTNNIDCPATGDISGIVVLLICSNPGIRIKYSHFTDNGNFTSDTMELKKELGNNFTLQRPVIRGLQELLKENLKEIKIIKSII